MEKLIMPTLEALQQTDWMEHHFELSNGTTFSICHNMPNIRGLCIDDAFYNWIARTSEYTAESFAEYIMSKHHMHGNYAYTRQQWDLLNE